MGQPSTSSGEVAFPTAGYLHAEQFGQHLVDRSAACWPRRPGCFQNLHGLLEAQGLPVQVLAHLQGVMRTHLPPPARTLPEMRRSTSPSGNLPPSRPVSPLGPGCWRAADEALFGQRGAMSSSPGSCDRPPCPGLKPCTVAPTHFQWTVREPSQLTKPSLDTLRSFPQYGGWPDQAASPGGAAPRPASPRARGGSCHAPARWPPRRGLQSLPVQVGGGRRWNGCWATCCA